VNEHEFEPVRGLPEALPEGERVLWQGSPAFRALALRAFHVRKVAIYFGLLMAWRAGSEFVAGGTAAQAAGSALSLVPLALAGVGLLALLAWLTARETVYTITDKRVVLRFGVALPMALNVPFRVIESAALGRHRDGTGDLPLALADGQRIGYLVNWPYVRGGRRSQPMLRAVPDAERVASLLAAALASHSGGLATAPVPRSAVDTANHPPRPQVAAPA
jgi:hypothetical protein